MNEDTVKDLAPNTPVIVGVGFCQEKTGDPTACAEPYILMINAIRAAAGDAGSDALLPLIESIAVQQGSWKYPNPGRLIAKKLGCPDAKSILSDLGVLQLTPFFELCTRISEGKQDVGVVTGGEARYRELRSLITQQAVMETVQPEDTPAPDVHHTIPDPFSSELEAERGVWAPGEFYAIAESALRYHSGSSVEENRDMLAELYSGFSEIAQNNPHAWSSDAMEAEDIKNLSRKNGMIAFPYTKKLMSQWNVNQSVAILVCSVEKALSLGLKSDDWIFPLAAVQSRHVVALAQKAQLHSHPGAVKTGERVFELAGISAQDLSAADLYSCFPSAIQSFAKDLKLDEDCPVSVTGTMAFAGGPFNHGGLDSAARMVEVLRSGEGLRAGEQRIGMVTNISGMFAKQACALFSPEPGAGGFAFDDITEKVAEIEKPLPLDSSYVGPATIVGYTVLYDKADISHAVAFCDTPDGSRTVVRCEDSALAQLMTEEEFCGRTVQVSEGGSFAA